MHYIDIIIILSYLIICLALGLWKSGSIKNIRQYTLGKTSFSTPVLAGTMFASYFSLRILLGTTRGIFNHPLYTIPLLLMFLSWFILIKILVKLKDKYSDEISLNKIMYRLYGTPGLLLASISALSFSLACLTYELGVIMEFFHYVYAVPKILCALFIILFIASYNLRGGFGSLVITDFFQCLMLFIILPILACILYKNSEGITAFNNVFVKEYKNISFDFRYLMFLFLAILHRIGPYTDGIIMQRAIVSKDKKQLKNILSITAILTLLACVFCIIIAVLLKSKLDGMISGEYALLFYIKNYLSNTPILNSLIIIGFLSMTMSLVDSHLNVCSTTIAHDLYKTLSNIKINSKSELKIARFSYLVFSIPCCILALNVEYLSKLPRYTYLVPYTANIVTITAVGFNLKFSRPAFYSGLISTFLISSIAIIIVARSEYEKFGMHTIVFNLTLLGSTVGFFGYNFFAYPKPSFKKIFLILVHKTVACLISVFYLFKQEFTSAILLRDNKASKHFIYITAFFLTTNILSIIFFPPINLGTDFVFFAKLFLTLAGITFLFFMHTLPKKIAEKLSIFYVLTSILFLQVVFSYFSFSALNFISFLISIYVCSKVTSKFKACFYSLVFCCILFVCNSFINFEISFYQNEIMQKINLASSIVLLILFITMVYKQKQFEKNLHDILFSSVIHDLRAPMSTIRNYAHALEANPNKATATKITGVVNESFKLVDEYLVNLKNTDSYKSKIEVKDFIKEFLADRRENINLKIQNSFQIRANPFLLKQVFINLLENAKDALKTKKDQPIEIKVYISANKGYISFKDYGCGIKSQDIDSIFDPFFTQKKDGKGIGLAFCKNILGKMMLEIECKSEYGKYTEFIISSELS